MQSGASPPFHFSANIHIPVVRVGSRGFFFFFLPQLQYPINRMIWNLPSKDVSQKNTRKAGLCHSLSVWLGAMSFLLSGLKHPTHSETLCTGWPRPGFCMPACPSCAKLLAYKLHPQVFSRENSGVLIPPTIWELDSKTLRLKRHAEALTLFMRTPGPELTAVAAAESLQLCLTLCNPVDCSRPGSSVYGILQERILEWVTMPSPRDRTCISYVSCVGRWVLYH